MKPHDLLNPAQTRWSLSLVIGRNSEETVGTASNYKTMVPTDGLLSARGTLTKALEPKIELYLKFQRFALPVFTNKNK